MIQRFHKFGTYLMSVCKVTRLDSNYTSVYPQKEENAIFITTSVISTYNQQRNLCPDLDKSSFCNSSIPCPPYPGQLRNGISLGICDNTTSHCMIYGWCPTEKGTQVRKHSNFDRLKSFSQPTPLSSVLDFTLFIKVNVLFQQFGISKYVFIFDKISVSYRYQIQHQQHCIKPNTRIQSFLCK